MRSYRHVWVAALALMLGLPAISMAQQDDEAVAPVRFGIFAGANYNSAGLGGNAANAIPGVTIPVSADLSDGRGFGPYAGLMFEYNPAPDQFLGVQARFGYDNRRVNIEGGGGDGSEVEASISYWAFEPALRFNLGSPHFHLTLGPGVHVLAANDFDFRNVVTVDAAGNQTTTTVEDLENGRLNDVAYSLWGGFGWDIPISDMSSGGNQWYLTPFVEASWLMNQLKTGVAAGNDNLDDTWSTVTLRGGLQLKHGWGGPESDALPIADVPAPAGDVNMAIQTPVGGVMAQRPMIEYLPLLNYVFYENSQTATPTRYTTLSSGQAGSFDENSLEAMDSPSAGDPSESNRSQRQLDVYYNVMNIIADRLEKNPGKNIEVVGSGPDVAAAASRAENVKNYLIATFGIPADRISSRGQKSPENPSGTRRTPKEDLPLVQEENIRVELLGDEELLKPVKLNVYQDMPIENDMAVTVESTEPIQRWELRVQGNGFDRTFGPFYGNTAYVNATPILGTRSNGTYTATVTATDRNGNTLTNSETFTLNKTTLEPVTSTRYSILFDYDEDESMERYDDFLRNTVAVNIPDGSIVYIHGHTDIAGLEDYNYDLSVRRAEEAERILADELKKLGKSNVTFESYGFGETQYRAPFNNDMPETRYYNRTVMIEIIPDSN